MSRFSADWLALREPYDRAARCETLAAGFAVAVAARNPAPVILDLGAGTGSGAAYLARFLPEGHRWILVDRDQDLLDAARTGRRLRSAAFCCLDLSRRLDDIDWAALDGVTATALFDLVSAPWASGLARRCATFGLPVLAALIYDGRMLFAPTHPDDQWIRALFNRHQKRDKGFGPALGPAASAEFEQAMRPHGYHIVTETSDWRFERHDREILEHLVDGIAAAAHESHDGEDDRVAEWRENRRRENAAGTLNAMVGHVDLLARPS